MILRLSLRYKDIFDDYCSDDSRYSHVRVDIPGSSCGCLTVFTVSSGLINVLSRDKT